jgi:hypothetical protein
MDFDLQELNNTEWRTIDPKTGEIHFNYKYGPVQAWHYEVPTAGQHEVKLLLYSDDSVESRVSISQIEVPDAASTATLVGLAFALLAVARKFLG